MARAPSAYAVEQAMSVLLSVRKRLLEDDPDIARDEKLFADMLEGESGDAMGTLHAMLNAILYVDDLDEAIERRIDKMRERQKRWVKRRETLRGGAFAAMDALELKRIELPDLTASIAAGQPAVVITDADALPEQMIRVKREPDKAAIMEALKAGQQVSGAELSNSLPNLRISTR